MTNTKFSWGALSKTFHWAVALLIFGAIGVAWSFPEGDAAPTPDDLQRIALHKSLGLTIFLLAIARLLWRWSNPVPTLAGLPAWQRWAARLTHYGLYLAILMMPISGFVSSYLFGHPVDYFGLGVIDLPIAKNPELGGKVFALHATGQWLIYGLLALHIGAALYHQFVLRDGVTRRMVPGGGTGAPAAAGRPAE